MINISSEFLSTLSHRSVALFQNIKKIHKHVTAMNNLLNIFKMFCFRFTKDRVI